MHLADNFDLPGGVLGGVIIGATSSALLFFTGRIAGISSIVEGILIADEQDDKEWTPSFVLGLMSAGVLLNHAKPDVFGSDLKSLALKPATIVVAGLLTGFGARLGNGCTSGHGVCGLPRRSPRSLLAVLTFMTTGAITAYLTRETALADIVYQHGTVVEPEGIFVRWFPSILTLGAVATLFNRKFILNKLFFRRKAAEPSTAEQKPLVSSPQQTRPGIQRQNSSFKELPVHFQDYLIPFASAFAFGIGLGLSGMCNRERVLKFLDFTGSGGFDPTLIGVMGGGVLVNLVTFHLMHIHQVADLKMDAHPDNLKIDWRLVLGSAIFGVGWGLGGMCPGPGLVSLGASIKSASIFVPALMVGMVKKDFLFGKGLQRFN